MPHRGQRPLTGPRINPLDTAPLDREAGADGARDSSTSGARDQAESSRTTPGPGSVTPSVRLAGDQPGRAELAEISALSALSMSSRSSSEESAEEPLEELEPIGYLLVIEGTASSVFTLPAYGEVTIGRAPDAHLRLLSPLVSRLHARLFIGDGEARVLDLGSHNGTRVNGALIATAHPLASGDIIAVSDVLLCFHRQVPRVLHRPIYPDPTVLRHRLEEEVDRSLRAGRRLRGGRRALERRYRPLAAGFRGLALLSIHLPGFGEPDRPTLTRALGQRVRLMDVLAFDGRDQLLILLPDVDEVEGARLTQRLLQVIVATVPGSRAGFACCPADGCDGDTLLAAARGAMAAADPAQALAAGSAVPKVRVDGRDLYFAEPVLWRLHELCLRLARGDQPVLILGEPGSGRATAAATIATIAAGQDAAPRRREGPFLRLDCRGRDADAPAAADRRGAPAPSAAAPLNADEDMPLVIEALGESARSTEDVDGTAGSVVSLSSLLVLDSEGSLPSQSSASLALQSAERPLRPMGESLEILLFGIERGALPDVAAGRAGLLEAAHGGTLYLAEVAELPLFAQGRLLRVLTTGRMTRVGGTRELTVDVRVLCSSSRDLHAEVRAGRFRADLLERLRGSLTGPPSGAVVVLPPLRERRRDLPVLIRAFLREACARIGREPPQLSPAAVERLLFHGWPGNLRELREVMESIARDAPAVCEPGHLPAGLSDGD